MNASRTLLAITITILVASTPAVSQVGFILVDDMYLPEGVFSQESTFQATLWTNHVVPYALDGSVTPFREAGLLRAMADWEAVADVDFVPRTTQAHFVYIQNNPNANNSNVGMIGGQQTINIANWNIPYIIVHELGHTLGLVHEHQRPDRDNFMVLLTKSRVRDRPISASSQC